ncbi:hypothetical protein [Parabacteroides goldsteinii]
MNKNVCFLLISFLLITCSCQNNIDDSDSILNQKVEIENVSFIYKGVLYQSEVQFINDQDGIFLNKEVQTIADNLKTNPNLSTFIHEDGTIEYFDKPEDVNSYLKSFLPKTKALAPHTQEGKIILFSDNKCKGHQLPCYISSTQTIFGLPTMPDIRIPAADPFNWDKAVSSIDMTCTYRETGIDSGHGDKCVASFFTGINFTGYGMWFAVDPSYPRSYIHYFGSYKLYPGSKEDWNDKTRSFKFTFSYN